MNLSFALMVGVLLLSVQPLWAKEKLPEPLTLAEALSIAMKSDHPDVLGAAARIASARADRAIIEADDDPELGLVGGLRLIVPPDIASDQDANDSYVRLRLKKRLHDFGRSKAANRVVDADLEGGRHRLMEAKQRRHLDVMQRFYAVLLADLRQTYHNEALATAYVTLDKARERVKLKQMSDTDLLALEDAYQRVRRQATASTHAQRAARSALAIAMNRPGELSSELTRPKSAAAERKLPELETLTADALSGNPRLKALRAEVLKEQRLVAKAQMSDNPILSGGIEAAAHQRDMGGYNPLAAELTLEIPLYRGGRVAAATAKARSGVLLKSSALKAAELEVQKVVTDLWLELQEVKVAKEGLGVRANYREMKLDRSRALYEMEVNTDLGDSMVAMSQQRLEEAELEFRVELVWAELDALTGRLIKD